MITVSDLEEISKDDELELLKNQLVAKKTITKEESQNLRGFYDNLYSPMDAIYCMIYPNTLQAPASVFGVTDDDAKYASASDLVSDDQIPTKAPSFAPTIPYVPGSPTGKPTPTPKPTGTTIDYILAFEVVYAPLKLVDIYNLPACIDYYYDPKKTKCNEFIYLESSVKVSAIYIIITSFLNLILIELPRNSPK